MDSQSFSSGHGSCFYFRHSRGHWAESEIKGCTLIHFRMRPNNALVLLDNSLHRRQAHAGAFEVFRAVQTLEDSKQLVGVLHTEADAIVADEDGGYFVDFGLPNLVNGRRTRPRIFECIGK